jgi:hypothetical protein
MHRIVANFSSLRSLRPCQTSNLPIKISNSTTITSKTNHINKLWDYAISIPCPSYFFELKQSYSSRRGERGSTKRTTQDEAKASKKKKKRGKKPRDPSIVKEPREKLLRKIQKEGMLFDAVIWMRSHNDTFEPPEDIPTISIWELRELIDDPTDNTLIIDLRDNIRGEPMIPRSVYCPGII